MDKEESKNHTDSVETDSISLSKPRKKNVKSLTLDPLAKKGRRQSKAV